MTIVSEHCWRLDKKITTELGMVWVVIHFEFLINLALRTAIKIILASVNHSIKHMIEICEYEQEA